MLKKNLTEQNVQTYIAKTKQNNIKLENIHRARKKFQTIINIGTLIRPSRLINKEHTSVSKSRVLSFKKIQNQLVVFYLQINPLTQIFALLTVILFYNFDTLSRKT